MAENLGERLFPKLKAIFLKIKAIAPILALVVSLVALGHTIWSHRQLRKCTHLYDTNGRLIELRINMREKQKALEEFRSKEFERFRQESNNKNSHTLSGEIAGNVISVHIDAVREFSQWVVLYQYVFPKEKVANIKQEVAEFTSLTGNESMSQSEAETFLSEVSQKTISMLRDMEGATDLEIEKVADQLRLTCE